MVTMHGLRTSGGGVLKKLRKNPDNLIISFCAFFTFFAISFIAGSFIIQPQTSKAIAGLDLVGAPIIVLTSSGNINLSVAPTSTGALASSSHNLSASTNVPTGYSLVLSTATASTLPATTGTYASPVALANNTWGYALANTGNFDQNYTAPNATSKWANPSEGATIKDTASSANDDNTTIYYGAKIDTSQASGAYTNTVRYTATANIADIPAPTIISITPDGGTVAGDTTITIVGSGFTVDDQSVTTAVNIDSQACTDVSISSNTPAIGQDTITCRTPAHAAGAVDVSVSTWGGTATTASGYTYMSPAAVTFVSPSIASTIPGAESGPAFTIVGSGFTNATNVSIGDTACDSFTVISDTHILCQASNTIDTDGSKAVVITKSDANSNSNIAINYNSTDYPTFSSASAFTTCSTTAQLFRDERDSQLYYVKKMPDNKCWMVDNLKYANYGDLSQETGKYLTADGTNTQSTENSDVAKFVDPGATDYCKGNTDLPANTNTRCGLLYNWYAATDGAGAYDENILGTNVEGSICPTNFRLPSALSNGSTATSNGTSHNAADFAVLNTSMNAGSLTAGSTTNYPTNWQPSGSWGGTFSGGWHNSFMYQSNYGLFWSSTVDSATSAYTSLFSTGVLPGNNTGGKLGGFAIRCVMEDTRPTPPAGSYPNNLVGTNPAVRDVYPTTGWGGDTVVITGKALFTNVTSVTIGGTACDGYRVVSTSVIACRLPAKTAGTSNAIEVINNGANVTPVSTYTHMKVTYFDPSSNIVTISGTDYKFFPNGFKSANCSALARSNANIGATPATSIAYFRDTRNKQTYKVKRMADNKCWMMDNLKYANASITFNNGDHRKNGGSGAQNTTNEATTQSDTNYNKAFYNNPMGHSYCYGTANMPGRTLTNCGYLYNWYAATNKSGTYGRGGGINAEGSICPANFRLPSGMSDGSTPTGTGSTYTKADFPVLNASMRSGAPASGTTNAAYYAGWMPSRIWGGTISGLWNSGLSKQTTAGYYWSSTKYNTANNNTNSEANLMWFSDNSVDAGNAHLVIYYGLAVRCVMP